MPTAPPPKPATPPRRQSAPVALLVAIAAVSAAVTVVAVEEWRIAQLRKAHAETIRTIQSVPTEPHGIRPADMPASRDVRTMEVAPGEQIDAIVAKVSAFGALESMQCTAFSTFLDGAQPKPVEASELSAADVRARILAAVPVATPAREALLERLLRGPGGDRFLGDLCVHGSDVYVTYVAKDYYDVIATKWVAEPVPHLRSYGPLGTMDGVYGIYSGTDDGRPLVRTGYGDVGYFWWAYYALDDQAIAADLVERCSMNFVYDEEAGAPREDLIEWQCDRRPMK